MCIAAQSELERLNKKRLLPLLLSDKTSGKNIIWATDDYSSLGDGYDRKAAVTADSLLTPPFRLMSRADKALSEQSQRTRTHAEVFTPFRIVKKMNDCIEEDWFGYKDPFGESRVFFPEGKSWQKYVDSRRLEITCGEAPYLVTRYDVTTGETIPVGERAGILDRKLRVVEENTETGEEWLKWTLRAYEATYGYEFQGDNVLLARLNLLLTFEEHMDLRFHREPTVKEYRRLLSIIAWNIWQMDGITDTIPYCRRREEDGQLFIEGFFGGEDESEETMRGCRVFDHRSKCSVEYNKLKERKHI